MNDTIKIAIVGNPGAGKTTFLMALSAFCRKKKSESPFRLEFANSDTAELLSTFYDMGNGKFPDSTLEGSKQHFRWKLVLPRGGFAYLESVDPIGQYISHKIQGGKKRAYEYENRIKKADVILFFIDSVDLKKRTLKNLMDYKELLAMCKQKKCPVAILLTKSDLIYGDDLGSPVEFLADYFPELDIQNEYVRFISIGEKEEFSGKKVLNVFASEGLDQFCHWLAFSISSKVNVEAFLSPDERDSLKDLIRRQRELETLVASVDSLKKRVCDFQEDLGMKRVIPKWLSFVFESEYSRWEFESNKEGLKSAKCKLKNEQEKLKSSQEKGETLAKIEWKIKDLRSQGEHWRHKFSEDNSRKAKKMAMPMNKRTRPTKKKRRK